MMTKICTKCGLERDLEEFYNVKNYKNGKASACKLCYTKYSKKYYNLNIDVKKEYSKKYRKTHKEKRKKYDKEYHKIHKEERNKCSKKYRKIYKKKVKEYNKKYLQTEKGKLIKLVNNVKRRAQKIATEDNTINYETLNKLLQQQNNKCPYCGESFEKVVKHLDHKIPYARGGTHTIKNVHYVCKYCNLSKNTKTHKEFVKELI